MDNTNKKHKNCSRGFNGVREEVVDLYQTLAAAFPKLESVLLEVKSAIENTKHLKKSHEKNMMGRILRMFNEANGLLDDVAEIGRTKK